MTIQTIVGALLALIAGWKQTDNLQNDLEDAVLALGTAEQVAPGAPIVGAAFKFATKAENSLADLGTTGYAIVGSIPQNGKTYSLVIMENGSAAAGNFGI